MSGGQVIGATDPDGIDDTDRRVGVPDLFDSVCRVLGIDPSAESVTTDDRPVRIVEGGSVIPRLFFLTTPRPQPGTGGNPWRGIRGTSA